MPTSIEDARTVEEHIDRIFSADSPRGRAGAIRRLFVEVLDFHRDAGQVSLAGAAKGTKLPAFAERIALLDRVHVLWVNLATKRVNKREAAEAARLIEQNLGQSLLLVCTNLDETLGDADQLHLILPDFGSGTTPTLRRMTVERGLPQRTAFEQIAGIYRAEAGPVRQALAKAFEVEPVTKQFFAEYDRIFKAAKELVTGFDPERENRDTLGERQKAANEKRHLFVQTLFNRLLFVHFLSRKGWLTFNDDKDYLGALWRDYQVTRDGAQTFYHNRLRPLFFAGLNNYRSQDLTAEPEADHLIGNVPFLNGGLFEETEADRRALVPDEAIEPLLFELFDRFNFTVMESTPFDIEVAVDPEMLGNVFEELVIRRHESGSYYTPRPVVSFMCREALKGYLEGCETGLDAEAIRKFVDEHDESGIPHTSAPAVGKALNEVTAVDPACGSGAYLLGMMQELIELWSVLYSDKLKTDARGFYELKLHIIERNLHGVDLDPFAANIAMLRLWLSLAVEYEGEPPIPPLPNLDFKIVCGDSLLGPDPSGLSLDRVTIENSGLGLLKAAYLHESDGYAKSALRDDIQAAREQVRVDLGGTAVADNVIDWRVEFAEVFASRGGFDIAIANPPYIQLQKEGGKLANDYSACGFETFARTGDIYQLFYERGCQLLKADRGLLAYITSNSWLRAEYGKRTRRYFAESHTPLRWLDLGKDVFTSAIVDSGVLLLRTGGGTKSPFPAVDMDRLPAETPIPPAEALWGEVRPDGVMPWSVLSQTEWAVMDKMHSRGTPLKDWDIAINYGVKTGFNEAFIIDNKTKEALVAEDLKSAEILKPVLRGRDIQRYQAEWAGMWLIDTHNGYDDVPAIEIDDYPAVKALLDESYDQLAKRHDKGRTPYNLRNCAYYEEFSREKLFWIDLSDEGRFSYDADGIFCVNSAYMMTGVSLKYLCAVLNSSLVTWFMQNSALNSGMGTARWVRFTVERIPVPIIDIASQQPFIRAIDKILDASRLGADTTAWEEAVDGLVSELYGLTEDELRATTS